jgi:hypothetical protein
MNKEEFRAVVYRAKPPSVSQTSLDEAIDFSFEWNLMDHRVLRACVRECINLAMRIDILRTADRSSQSGESPFQRMPLMPEALVMSDDFAEKIRPAVEQLRNTLFDSPAPPFPAYEDAAQWLEQTAAEQDAYAQANSQTRIALERTIHDKLTEYRVLTGEDYQSPFLPNLLEYAKPGSDWVHRVHVWGGTSLATLAHTSRRLADATGFSQASVVAYVLARVFGHS